MRYSPFPEKDFLDLCYISNSKPAVAKRIDVVSVLCLIFPWKWKVWGYSAFLDLQLHFTSHPSHEHHHFEASSLFCGSGINPVAPAGNTPRVIYCYCQSEAAPALIHGYSSQILFTCYVTLAHTGLRKQQAKCNERSCDKLEIQKCKGS